MVRASVREDNSRPSAMDYRPYRRTDYILSKKNKHYQELIESDPISGPQNQKGNN